LRFIICLNILFSLEVVLMFLKSVYFLAALSASAIVSALGGGVTTTKIVGVVLLSFFQYHRVAVHPGVPPKGTPYIIHVISFLPVIFIAVAFAFGMRYLDVPVGYPALGSWPVAFFVPFGTFRLYRLGVKALVASGKSHLLANLVLLVFLLAADVPPFYLNPIVSLVCFVVREHSMIYLMHVAAIAADVLAELEMERLSQAATKKAQ
jgi:hypothetical protein